MKKIFSLIIVCLLITACGEKKFQTIDSNKAMELIDNGAVVIDVRENSEFSTGHIANAINIPLGNIDSLDLSKDTVLIVYCATGIRSLEAAKSLSNLGYTSLYNLDGGLLNWGFDLEE